jgi:hypothetical protein
VEALIMKYAYGMQQLQSVLVLVTFVISLTSSFTIFCDETIYFCSHVSQTITFQVIRRATCPVQAFGGQQRLCSVDFCVSKFLCQEVS